MFIIVSCRNNKLYYESLACYLTYDIFEVFKFDSLKMMRRMHVVLHQAQRLQFPFL